jgi:hypothetical protein
VLRLTLRTLLAYLDDTLDPAQAKAMGQKVAESESARELIERIRQVTRRRRLTTPPTTGPGSNIDPNTVAEYLDNEVSPEQAAEVEQICLSSDVHLAEVAACHQVLTLILGEPVKPPAAASQRMYGLVKGPGAIPFRKPSVGKTRQGPEPYAESKEIDETLRLGLPPMGKKDGWRNPLILIGGGVLAVGLLVFAIFQVLNLPGDRAGDAKNNRVAQGDGARDKTEKPEPDAAKEKDKDERKTPADKKGDDKQTTDQAEPGKDKNVGDKKDAGSKTEPPAAKDVAFGPPNPREAVIGHYVTDAKDSSIVLQLSPDSKIGWKRLTAKQSEVKSARPLLSLPGSRGVVQTNRGVSVTLWGNMPEFYALPIFESLVELYSHDVFDLDLLLQRGRIVLTSTRKDRPVSIRLRFENPLVPSYKDLMLRQEFFDVELLEEGASMLFELWSNYPPSEPFYKDPKNPNREGPTADMGCIVLRGSVRLKTGDTTSLMTAPPGAALMKWNSREGPRGPSTLAKSFDFDNPPLAPGIEPKARKDMVKAREYLSAQLASSNVDVGLAQALDSPDLSTRRLVVRSLAAVSDLPGLLEALDQSKVPDLRLAAIDALRNWIATSRDNDYKLFNLLKEKYKNKEAEIIMEMMHSYSFDEIRRPERYELLIDYLVNPNLVIRELGHWHLNVLVPQGRNIPYSASADSQVRERAEAMWRQLIPRGQLPPSVAPGPGSKKK